MDAGGVALQGRGRGFESLSAHGEVAHQRRFLAVAGVGSGPSCYSLLFFPAVVSSNRAAGAAVAGMRSSGATARGSCAPTSGGTGSRGRTRYATGRVAARGKREADNALAAFVASVGNGAARPSAAVTFGELVERWIDTARPEWSPG